MDVGLCPTQAMFLLLRSSLGIYGLEYDEIRKQIFNYYTVFAVQTDKARKRKSIRDQKSFSYLQIGFKFAKKQSCTFLRRSS